MKKLFNSGLLLSVLLTTTMSSAQNIDVRAYKKRFSEVMAMIGEKSKKKIVLETDQNPLVSIGAKDLSLEETLTRISNLYGFDFEVDKNQITAKEKVKEKDKKGRSLASLEGGEESADGTKEAGPVDLRAEGFRYYRIPVAYSELSFVQKQIENAMGPSIKKNLTIDVKSKVLVVYGNDETRRMVQMIANEIDVPPAQILLSAKVVELTRSFARDIGVALQRNAGLDKGNVVISNPSPTNRLQVDYRFGIIDAIGVDAKIAMGESNGNAKIISNPQVVTADDTAASLDSGITFSIRVSNFTNSGGGSSSGSGSSTGSSGSTVVAGGLEKVTAGLKMSVTPKILRDGRIKLKIDITSSSPDKASSVDNIPGIIQTGVKTEMVVRPGQTAAIAGLYKFTDTTGDNGVPFLMNLPIFGYLFKSNGIDRKRQEVMAFITPTVLDSANDRSITLKAADGDDLDMKRSP